MRGKGQVSFGEQVRLGYSDSPGFWSTYQYFDLRGDNARIHIGSQVILNNNTSLTADNASITIGDRTVAGLDLTIMPSDGHGVDPERRHNENYPCCSVQIGENVFIGDHVIILKGVTIGRDCVIGAGSVVTKSIPERVVAAGNPCRIIRTFN
jgi:maltose O-acetyltransferase